MSDVNVVILVDKDKKGEIDQVAENLVTEGLKVDRKMPLTGIISGSAANEKLDALRKVKGVSHLREEEVISLPPVDEEVPQ